MTSTLTPDGGESLLPELDRARRIAARSDVDPAWAAGAQELAQAWADAEARDRGWPVAPVTVPSVAALPDVLAAVARARLEGVPDAGGAGRRMAADLAELRRQHGG